MCIYVCTYMTNDTNDAWCRDAVVVCKNCSPLVEFMIIKCRPFYLPREYTAIMLAAVYIPPNSNNNRSEALNELYEHISEQQTAHPDAFSSWLETLSRRPKDVFPKIPTCWLSNTGKQHSGLCLHHPERSLQGPTRGLLPDPSPTGPEILSGFRSGSG